MSEYAACMPRSTNFTCLLLLLLLLSLTLVNLTFRYLLYPLTSWMSGCTGELPALHLHHIHHQVVEESHRLSWERCGSDKLDKTHLWSQESQAGEVGRVLSGEEYEQMMVLTAVVHHRLMEAQIPYIMYSGTLLGSYFFHDVIPWDDDIDLIAPLSRINDIIDTVSQVPGIAIEHVLIDADDSDKRFLRVFYQRTREHFFIPRSHNGFWTFPFVDIGLYGENSTHIWDSGASDVDLGKRTFPTSDIFPTVRRPLGSLWLQAPRDPYAFLYRLFSGRFRCERGGWDHRLARVRPESQGTSGGRCDLALQTYPVVERKEEPEGGSGSHVLEMLRLPGTGSYLYQCLLKEPSHTCCREYLAFQ